MSRYACAGKERRYRITAGFDKRGGSLFAQVEDLAWKSGGEIVDDDAAIGDSPEEGLLVWVGTRAEAPILDAQALVRAVASYGSIPLPIQVQLLHDLDRELPLSVQSMGLQLAAICQQAPPARLLQEPEAGKTYYILLNQDGWQLRDWQTLPPGDTEQAFGQMVYTTESDREQLRYPEPVASYISDPAIFFRVHLYGLNRGLPVFAALARGVLLSGPCVIANEASGLWPAQVRLVQQEVFFVDEAIREQVTALWAGVWARLGGQRGG